MVPPTFLRHSLGSSRHLHCVATKIQHQLEPTLPNMWQQKQRLVCLTPFDGEVWGIPYLSFFIGDNAEVYISYHLLEFPNRMKLLFILSGTSHGARFLIYFLLCIHFYLPSMFLAPSNGVCTLTLGSAATSAGTKNNTVVVM